ncbi:MAG: glycosyl hydrolase family 28 protein [Lentisphaeria bacterium]
MKVQLNNKDIVVYDTFVSKYPIDQVWNGYQREKSQRARAYFATFDIDGKSVLELKFTTKIVPDIRIRPGKLNLDFLKVDDFTLTMNLEKPCQFVVENGDEVIHVFCNEVFHYEQKSDDLYFGPGVHDVGVLALKSGQRVCLDEGAIVYGAIVGYKVENVEVVGRGILDSSKLLRLHEAKSDEPGGEVLNYFKGLGYGVKEVVVCGNLALWNCKNIKISGIILVDSPSWSVITRNGCKDIVFDNIKIVGQWRYNSDGIDICTSENVLVQNCFVRSFDDCLVVRAPYLYGENAPCKKIRFEHCVLWCDWGKNLEIWCGEKECVITDVLFEDLYLIKITHYAMSITTTYGSASTRVKNIRYRNIFLDSDDFYPTPVMQKSKGESIPVNSKSYDPVLLYISYGFLGRDLGNQKCEVATDRSRYNLCYENISFENVRSGDRKFSIEIKADEPILAIKNLSFSMVDYQKMSFSSCLTKWMLTKGAFF